MKQNLPVFAELFAPGRMGNMGLKNRLVMAAMGNQDCSEEGHMTPGLVNYYLERVEGGVGLVISNPHNVSRESHFPFRASIFSDAFVPGLRQFTESVHRLDGKVCAQIIRRTGVIGAKYPVGHAIFVPSVFPFGRHVEEHDAASDDDIAGVIQDFVTAAVRARAAGFDAVELHACHGPMCALSAFLSPFLNRRRDRYGGSVENRTLIVRQILGGIRDEVGNDFPLLVRLNGVDGIEGGITLSESMEQAKLFEQAGADAINVSAGMEPWTFSLSIPPYAVSRGVSLPYAAAIKKAVRVPVIAAGRIDYLMAEAALSDKKVDFVAFGRPLLADPWLPNKLREGHPERIVDCIYCNNCMEHKPRRCCTVNPYLLREREFKLRRTASAKKFIVVGGGVGGMQTAIILAERGHNVILYEKADKVGGQFNIAALQNDKEHFSHFIEHLAARMSETAVDVRMKQVATAEVIADENPDAVILATGASPAGLALPGGNGENVVQGQDVIAGRKTVGERVAILGGRLIGMELAVDLAKKGKRVCIVTRSQLGREVGRTLYFTFRHLIIENHIVVYQNSPVVEINERGVYFLFNGDLAFEAVDTIVLAVGSAANDELCHELRRVAPDIPVHLIGDCREPRNARMATMEAAELAHSL